MGGGILSNNEFGNRKQLFAISNEFIDGRHDAQLQVTPLSGYSSSYGGQAIGVWYTGTQWAIYNESTTAMTSGQLFNVAFTGYANQQSSIHQTFVFNRSQNYTWLDDPRLNDNPWARIFVTHVYNPPGGSGNYHNRAIGAWYHPGMRRWTIYNEDLSTMQTGRTFLVMIAAAPVYGMAGLWPRYDESPTTIEGDREVQFMHVYADPLAGGSGSYFTPFTTGFWQYTCHPLYGCIDRTVPGSASGPASTSFRFNRWVTVDALW